MFYKIVFEGVRGERYTGDTAIDDVSILNFRCETKTPSSITNIMQSTTKEQPHISPTVPKRLDNVHHTVTSSSLTSSHITLGARDSVHSTPSLSSILPSVAADCFNVKISLTVSTAYSRLASTKATSDHTSSSRQTTQ